VAGLRKQNLRLQDEITRLTATLEEERRRGKRQAAPFSKGPPVERPRKPGRKKGRRHGPHAHRSVPPRIDERYRVPVPCQCPDCGSWRIRKTGLAVQYQTEIPRNVIYRQFDIEVGECRDCGRQVRGRHELQTSTAGGAAASQLGAGVHALLAILNKELGLSHGKSARLLRLLFPQLRVARSTSVRSVRRTAERVQPAVEQIRQDIRGAREVAPDETGWRVGGKSAWLHDFVSRLTTYYEIHPGRGHEPAEAVLGSDWTGTLVHDGWKVYNRFEKANHQQCLGHLQRRCQQRVELAHGAAARLPRSVLGLIDLAYAVRRAWRGHRISKDEMAASGLQLSCQLQDLAEASCTNTANRRLAKHILKHCMNWFWFLIDPSIQSTNHWAERGIRPAVVNRKVWGGNRTWTGAGAQSRLMSVIETAKQRALEPFDFLYNALTAPSPFLFPEIR
jgi:transposase